MDIVEFRKELQNELEGDILPFWMQRMTCPEGGFYGRMDGSGEIDGNADKGCILNARILWTFASAYRLTQKAEYLRTAETARDEILKHFIDKEFGGTYWSIDKYGNPTDSRKQIYAIAFSIYGLSEMHRASGDKSSLEEAIKLYHSIEQHSFDPVCNGYLEALTRNWQRIADMRLSDKDLNAEKTMNTHLHVLEAYTSLFRVWKDERLKRQLSNLIDIFINNILCPDAHLGLFFDNQWNPVGSTISYGHDIECSWLLAEAAEVLEDKELATKVDAVCIRIATAAVEGWSENEGMIYEKDPATGRIDADRHWWVQAETLVGFIWQYRRSGEAIWLQRALSEWKFIKNDIICPDGEWYWSRRADGSANTDDDRAGFWKCPYHNARMCMEAAGKL